LLYLVRPCRFSPLISWLKATLVIFGDDVDMWNLGACTHGIMGHTPNIDRNAKQGMLFTDHYAQPSCTAGRAIQVL